ncbi:DNA/RNA-binding protein KIN17-like, partial [Tropilaelaps mercedesae]
EFKQGYLDVLKRQYGGKRVHANQIYQEYIRFKEHVHMNSTRWLTLTEFVKWLGKEGICAVDETEKGWFVAYIDRTSEAILAEERRSKKAKLDRDDEKRTQKYIQLQLDRLKEREQDFVPSKEISEDDRMLKRENQNERVKLSFSGASTSKESSLKEDTSKPSTLQKLNPLSCLKTKSSRSDSKDKSCLSSKRSSALDEIMMEETKKKSVRNDYWLITGIVVKVVTRSLGEKYFKQKGIVTEVVDRYGAVVKLLDSGVSLKLDQVHCETVIPALGKKVKIVNGPYRGHEATLQRIDVDKFCATLKLNTGAVVQGVDYEYFSKLYSS